MGNPAPPQDSVRPHRCPALPGAAATASTFTAACLLTLLLAGCGGGGETTVTLTGTADPALAGSRVTATSLKDGRTFPGPEGAVVEKDGRFAIDGAPEGHRFLLHAKKGARSEERITGRAHDDDGDGAYEDGLVDTASTATTIMLGQEVARRLDGRAHIERGEFNRRDADAIEDALSDLEHFDHGRRVRRLGEGVEQSENLCADGDLDATDHVRVNAYLAARAVIRVSREDADGDDLRAWLRTGRIGSNVRVPGKVMHPDCTLQDDPDLDPDDVGGGDTTPPETTVTAGPADPTRATDAAFVFDASEAGSTFECALDGAAFAACVSGQAYAGLAAGSHAFDVRATDPWGNADPTPARFPWNVDTTPPVLTVPPDAIVEAPGDTSPAATGTATATDADDPAPVVTFADASVPGTGQLLATITRTWTATDAAGNSASADQAIAVRDTTPPVLTLLGTDPATVAHDAVYVDAGATALDAVDGDLTAAIVTGDPVDTGALGDYTVTYDVSDAAGNPAARLTRAVHVTDEAPPALTVPPDATVEAPGDTSPAATGTATATDAADPAPVVTFADAATPGAGTLLRTITRTWTATDAAGNSASADQAIRVEDTTPPALTVPPDAVVEAYGDTSPAATGAASASDAVDPAPTVAFTDVTAPGTGQVVSTITRTWTAIDASGNGAGADQVVTVRDTTPPTVIPPADITVVAADDTGTPATDPQIAAFLAGATATDVVGVAGPVTHDAPALFPPGTTVVTFSAADAAGNVGTATARVTVDRCGAATVQWTATTSGYWRDPANWSTGAVPGPADVVCIDVASDITVTHALNTDRIGTLVAFNRVTVSGGTLEIADPSRIGNAFTLSGSGTLTGAGDLTVTGLLTWSGGTMTGTGATVAEGGAELSVASKRLGRTFRIPAGATADWTAGSVAVESSGTFDNAGTFRAAHAGGASLYNAGGVGTRGFRNTGTFVKAAPAAGSVGTTTFGNPLFLDNDGTVHVRAGELRLEGGGTHTGAFDAAGGTLTFASANTFQAGAAVTGTGSVAFGSGATSTFQAGSTYAVAGTTTVGGTLDLSGGGPVTMGSYVQSAGTLTGSDTVTVTGSLTWNGGTLGGTGAIVAAGTADFGGSTKTLGRAFTVPAGATATWTAGSTALTGAGGFDNAGTFRVAHAGNASLFNGGGTGTRGFHNTGTFVKAAPAAGSVGMTTFGNPLFLDNDGTVRVQSGELRIEGGGTHTGAFDAAGTLTFASTNTFQAGAAVTGAGHVAFAYGTASAFQAGSTYAVAGTTTVSGTLGLSGGGAVTMGSYVQSAGTLTGSDTVTVTGPLTWTGGTLDGTGAIVAAGGADLGGTTKTLGRTFTVPAGRTASWTAGSIAFTGAGTFANLGRFEAAHAGNASLFNGGGTGARGFDNAGTFVKIAPAAGSVGLTTLGSPVFFHNHGAVALRAGTLQLSGAVYTQTAGSTTLDGGGLLTNTPVDIQGGLLQGTGAVTGPVTNAGRVAPGLSPGMLTVSGSYTQASGGALAIELGGLAAGSGHDQLAVAGEASLGGTLDVSLLGGFVPSAGDTFDVVTYGLRTPGTGFATVSLPAGVSGTVSYGADRATLTITGVSLPAGSSAGDPDPDRDGLTTTEELALGTDPSNADSDADGVGDGVEVLAGADPLVPEASAHVLFVAAATGNDAWPGTGWATAKATTQAALAAAPDGAPGAPTFILHDAGTYPGGVAVSGRTGLVLVGSVGPAVPFPAERPTSVLDAGGAGGVVTIDASQEVTLIGFELTGGWAADGGGLRAVVSAPVRVYGALIRANAASQRGGGVYVEGGSLELRASRVAANDALAGGGGLYLNGGSLRVEDSLFTANRAGAEGGAIALVLPLGTVDVFNNLLVGNVAATGGALAMTDPGGGTVVRANTMAWNQATTPAGGGAVAYANPGLWPDPLVADNVLWHNEDATLEAANDPGDDLAGPITAAVSNHNDIGQGPVNAGTDMSVDPGFTRGFYLDQSRVAPAGPVDGGSTAAADLFTGLETTDAAGTPDSGTVDMGFHHDAGAPAGTLTVVVGYPSPPVGYAAGQAAVIRPEVDGADLGPGHRVAVRAGAGTTPGVTLAALSPLDPLSTGDSVLADDNGDGTYTVYVDTTAAAGGTLSLDVHVDDDPPLTGAGATAF